MTFFRDIKILQFWNTFGTPLQHQKHLKSDGLENYLKYWNFGTLLYK